MRAAFKNTTAIIAAVSMSVPTVVPAQGQSDACQGHTVSLTAVMADEIDLFLSEPLRTALEGGEVQGGLTVAMMGDEPALCLTEGELALLGASESQIAMIVDAQNRAVDEQLHAEATEADAGHGSAEGTTADAEIKMESMEADPAGHEDSEGNKTETDTAEAGHAVGGSGVQAGEVHGEAAQSETAEAGHGGDSGTVAAEAGHGEGDAGNVTVQAEDGTRIVMESMSLGDVSDDQSTPATDTAPDAEAAAEETAEAGTDTEAAQTETAAAERTAEVDTNAAVTEALEETAAAIETRAVEEADAEVQAEIAEQDAPEEAIAATEDAEVAEVEEEIITEESARSSTEEFESRMESTAGATATGDDDGLSNFEKALIAGLGAIVVGKALGDGNESQVVSKSQDRVVVLEDGRYRVIRDDNELIERPGSTVRRERFDDGSTRTTVTREDGVQIVTIRDAELRVVRRARIDPNGTETVLIDDTTDVEPVDVAELPELQTFEEITAAEDREALRKALERENIIDRRFALYQVRNIERVRKLAPAIALDAINFRSGSAVIDAEEVRELTELGDLIAGYIDDNPGEVFLIEGHTDAVGNAAMNLALSDRRAESVALALTEFFGIPPENLVVQGYGESDLKVKTLADERANRRAAVRRITPLITASR